MPTRDAAVQDFVVAHLRTRYPKARVVPLEARTNLVAAGVLDSFAFLDLLSEVEQRFDIQIDVGQFEFEVLSTLGGLCDAAVASS